MAVTGRCEIVVDAPLAVAFGQFVDCNRWSAWMPEAFRPVKTPRGALPEGGSFTVKIPLGALEPTLPVKVFRVRPNHEVAWGGGARGVLHIEHCFFFEHAGEGRTRIRSEETFRGLLTLPTRVGRRMEKEIVRIGEAQLAAFCAYVGRVRTQS